RRPHHDVRCAAHPRAAAYDRLPRPRQVPPRAPPAARRDPRRRQSRAGHRRNRTTERPSRVARGRAGGRPPLRRRRRRGGNRRLGAGRRGGRRGDRRRPRGAVDGVVLCSRNRHKARELERLLPGWTIEPLDRDDYPPETGATYYENAALKARFGREHVPGWVLAEDSGLEVAALDGRPGVLSARYAPEGAPAVAKLLGELEGVEQRGARYVSELVLLAPGGEELRGIGTLEGRIAREPAGTEGFGY